MIFDQKFMTDLAVFCEDGNGGGSTLCNRNSIFLLIRFWYYHYTHKDEFLFKWSYTNGNIQIPY